MALAVEWGTGIYLYPEGMSLIIEETSGLENYGGLKQKILTGKVEYIKTPEDTQIPSGHKKVWTVRNSADDYTLATWEDDGTGQLVQPTGDDLWARIVLWYNGVFWNLNEEIVDGSGTEVGGIGSTYEPI